MPAPMLSVILPCYRAGVVVVESVDRLQQALDANFERWEIIVVDDGGDDIPESLCRSERIRVIRFARNRGKGAAVRAGMLAANGEVRIFTDVDLPYGTEVVPVMAKYISDCGFHAVIGDRTLPGSSYLMKVNWGRRLASSIFSAFVGRIVTGGFFDTQCGLKAFRGDVAQALFSILQIDRFAFDVEAIYVCLKYRLDMKRIPAHLESNFTSSVRIFRDSAQGVIDTLRIKVYQLRGRYRSAELERVVQEDYLAFVKLTVGEPHH